MLEVLYFVRLKIKKLILIVLVPVFAFASVPLLPSIPTYAAPKAGWVSGNNVDGVAKVKAWLYYKAFRKCLSTGKLKNLGGTTAQESMSQDDAASYDWFFGDTTVYNTTSVTVGSILDPTDDSTTNTDDGVLNCGADEGRALFAATTAAFGETSGPQFLCDVGFFRVLDQQKGDQTGKKNSDGSYIVDAAACPIASSSSNDFKTYASQSLRLKLLDNAMDTLFNYGGNEPAKLNSLSPGTQYLLYRESFLAGACGVVSKTIPYDKNAVPGNDGDYIIHDVDPSTKNPITIIYKRANTEVNKDTFIPLYQNVTNNEVVRMSCAALALAADSLIQQYTTEVRAGLNGGTPGAATSSAQNGNGATQCVIDSIGWLICGLMNAVGGLNDLMYGWIKGVLILNPLQTLDSSGQPTATFQTWQNVRNIANILLVIGFIFIIFSQLTSIGVSNYGVKKLLPRIILVAIAINLSYIVMQVSIDVVNLLGVGLETVMKTTGVNVTISTEQVVQMLTSGETTTGIATGLVGVGVGTAAIAISGASAGSLALLALPFILVALLGLFAAVATLFIRNALIIVLVVLSPVAFAAYLLPNTESLFTRWRKLFISMLILFPMATLLFTGAKFAAYIVIASGVDYAAVIALFIMGAPLGALPFLIKSSNSVLSGIGGKLQGLAQSARNPLQKAVQPKADQLMAQRKSGDRNIFGRQYNEAQLQRRRDKGQRSLAERANEEKIRTEMKTEDAGKSSKENFRERALGTGDHALTAAANRPNRIMAQRNRDAALFDDAATLGEREKASGKRISERQADRARAGATNAALGGDHNADSLAAAQLHDATIGTNRSEARIKELNTLRVRTPGTPSTTTGESLLQQSQQTFASEQETKNLEGQILNINRGSGAADASVQGQKTNDLVSTNIDSHEQDTFDASVAANTGGLRDITLDTEQAKGRSGVSTANVASEVAAEKTEGGSMFDTETERKSFEAATASSAAEVDKTMAEAAVVGAPPIPGMSAQARLRTQTAARQTKLTRDATTGAARMGATEYAQELLNNPGAAAEAGGIDAQFGPQRAQNAARAQITSERRERIKQIRDGSTILPNDAPGMGAAFRTAAAAGDVETMTAYAEMLAESGDAGIRELRGQMHTLEATLPPDVVSEFAADVRRTPSITSAAQDFDQWSLQEGAVPGISTGPQLTAVTIDPGTYTGLSPQQFAGNKQSTQILAIPHLTAGTVAAILRDTAAMSNIKGNARTDLIAHATTLGVPLPPGVV